MAPRKRNPMGGRPSKFSAEVAKRILETVGVGVPYAVAASYAGITDSTLRRWLRQGRKAKSGELHDFAKAMDQAEARAEVRVVAEWQKHLPKKWEACRDFLARRFPERWAETQKLHVLVEREVEAMLADLKNHLPREVYEQVLEGLAKTGGGGPPAGAAQGGRPDRA